jgi:HEAT repeats
MATRPRSTHWLGRRHGSLTTCFLVRALACVLALVPLAPRAVFADDRTTFLIDHLKYPPSPGQSDDFRVRTNAALQLGRTNDDAAVQPLCAALSDPSDVVRLAVAAGLKRLARPAALPCLKDRLAVESNAAAKTQIQDAISSIPASGGGGGGGGGGSLANVPNAKFYVALSRVTNNTGRPQAEIDAVVLGAIQAKLASLGNYQLAPTGEAPTAARGVISGRHMKGYYLSILVDKFDYAGGDLRVKVKLAVFTYPGKDLRGEVPVSPVQTGVTPGDKSSEDNLMGLAAGHAVELFAQSFQ